MLDIRFSKIELFPTDLYALKNEVLKIEHCQRIFIINERIARQWSSPKIILKRILYSKNDLYNFKWTNERAQFPRITSPVSKRLLNVTLSFLRSAWWTEIDQLTGLRRSSIILPRIYRVAISFCRRKLITRLTHGAAIDHFSRSVCFRFVINRIFRGRSTVKIIGLYSVIVSFRGIRIVFEPDILPGIHVALLIGCEDCNDPDRML